MSHYPNSTDATEYWSKQCHLLPPKLLKVRRNVGQLAQCESPKGWRATDCTTRSRRKPRSLQSERVWDIASFLLLRSVEDSAVWVA